MHSKYALMCLLIAGSVANAQSIFDEAFAKGEAPKSQFALSAAQGPYMVKIASFTGPDSEKYAANLANELREKHKIEAFVHRYRAISKLEEEEKDLFVKRFYEKYKIKPRLPKMVTPPPDNWVVLAGDFKSIEDSKARTALENVRRINPQTLPAELVKRLMAEGVLRPERGFTSAMLVRNPVLPPDRAGVMVDAQGRVKPTIDRKAATLLQKLNDQEQYSVYKNSMPYTIKVAEFRGASVFDESKAEKVFGSLKGRKNVDSHKSALQKGAENAIILCDAMRKEGYEAYVFHGEYASIVTVGGYRNPKDPRILADIAAINESMAPVSAANQKRPQNQWQVVLAPSPIVTPRRPTADMIAN